MRGPHSVRVGRWLCVAGGVMLLACGGMGGKAFQPSPAETARMREEYQRENDYKERVRQYGDTVKFVFTQPEGATYRIDGRDYQMPAQVSLSWRRSGRQYPVVLNLGKDENNRDIVYNGEIEVFRTNAGTKMGLITVDQITQQQLRSFIDRGEPFRVRFDVLRETVAEIRLGNRNEIDYDSVMINFPGIEKEVEKERDLATEAEKEWSRWCKQEAYSVPEDLKERVSNAGKTFAAAQDHTKAGRNEDAADAWQQSREMYRDLLSRARKDVDAGKKLEAARASASDWLDSWNLWWAHNADKQTPDDALKAEEEFMQAERNAADSKTVPAAEGYEKSAGLYKAALENARRTTRPPKTIDQAKAEVAAYQDAWTKWADGKKLAKTPLDITKAAEEVAKAEKYVDEKKEKFAVISYENARKCYTRALLEAKERVREEKELDAIRMRAEGARSDWQGWELANKPPETPEIAKARETMDEAAKKAQAGDFRDAADAYENATAAFVAAYRAAREKSRSSEYMEALVSCERREPMKTPYDYTLRHSRNPRPYEGTLEFRKQKYYLSLRVLNVTEFTRISKVVLRDITERVLRQAAGGKPSLITYRLDDKPVLELAIGNRPPE